MVNLGSGAEREVEDIMLTPDNLDENCIPHEIINMDVADYHSFLEARRKLMAQKVKAYFNAL
jgi:hypothetical protein